MQASCRGGCFAAVMKKRGGVTKMSNAVKKKSRRMWRRVRKTLGTLFLVSALVIAAIPVDNLRAADPTGSGAGTAQPGYDSGNTSYACKTSDLIPQMNEDTKIYTTADEKIQFAFLNDGSGYGAVIVGYNANYLADGTLDFTKPVDAYGQYRINDGQNSGYNFVAVGLNGNFLFYEERQTRTVSWDGTNGINVEQYINTTRNPNFVEEVSRQTQEVKDASGNVTGTIVTSLVYIEKTGEYLPCYTGAYDTWSKFGDNELYYDKNDLTGDDPNDNDNNRQYELVGNNANYQRIKNATITYISNQFITTDDKGKWTYKKKADGKEAIVDDTCPDKGVFANQNNVKNLIVSPQFKGIGDYAFYNSGITTIKLENGMQCIGNHAFDSCRSLASIDVDLNCNLTELGAYAFKDCQTLMKFVLPNGVVQIDDGAFEGCMAMTELDLCSNANVNALQRLGRGVFKNCSSLPSLTFPNNCADNVYMSSFKGCNNLKWISTRNRNIDFPDGDDSFTYNDFKNQVTSEFYFEGLGDYTSDKTPFSDSTVWDSKVHELAWRECFPFSYLSYIGADPATDQNGRYEKQDHYELTTQEEASAANKNTFVVNSGGNLEKHVSTDGVKELDIPNKIGPYTVAAINSGVFENSCNIEKVTIPETVKTIRANAFKGSHNLTSVLFNSADVVIESNAFKTQDVAGSHRPGSGCNDVETDSDNTPTKKLSFIGPISASSTPFQYAMSSEGRYNAPSQKESYITYYSGWPTNLKVEYDPNAVNPNTNEQGMSILTDFPSLEDLQAGIAGTSDYTYLTTEQIGDAQGAAKLYKDSGSTAGMTENQIDALNGALNLVIPEGVEAIAPGLVRAKEKENVTFAAGSTADSKPSIDMTITAFSLAAVENGEAESRDKNGVATFKDGTGTFAGCEHLKGVTLNADSSNSPVIIEDYAFEGCKILSDVSMADVASLGKAPFFGCEELGFVNFQNNPRYSCDSDKSIIYGLDENGNANTIIECLPGRASNLKEVTATELGSGITTIAPEAFRGSHVRSVDLSSTNVASIPEGAFANTNELQTVTFPETLTIVGNYAFAGSGVDSFYVKGKNTGCSPFAFYGESTDAESTKRYGIVGLQQAAGDVRWYYAKDGVTSQATGTSQGFLTEETEFPTAYYVIYTYRGEDGEFTDETLENRVASVDEARLSYPEIPQRVTVNGMTYSFTDWEYVLENGDTWHFTAQYDFALHVITFMDSKNGLREVHKMEIADGGNALRRARDVEELAAIMDDPTFVTWDCEGNLEEVTGDYTAVAKYRNEGEYIVRFYVRKGSISSPYELQYTTTVKEGESAPSITIPTVTDYVFTEWDKPLNNIQEDTDFYARYAPAGDDNPSPSPGPDTSPSPSPGPDTSPSPSPSPGPDTSPSPSPGPDGGNSGSGSNTGSSNNVARHTLQVRGGSGSGLYAAGEQIIITADEPARGQEFTSWTVSPASTVVTDKTVASFILTMPNNDVAVIANYRARSSGSATTGSGNSSNTNTNRPNGSTGRVGGTTVVIDKNGLSNTGVVSATVNGSSDNFTIKITDSSSAAEAVLRALQAEYGNLDNIKYFPMDISLYDSTGNTKITDTTGLSVDITLPLPDSLITYAGNNKVAGVVNDRLDKLTPRFTTISGVPCITFRAEHFSPYVIYVDIANLSDGTITDDTPTTGDGIHPKWFLSIGLACLSFVMFMMKDGKSSSNSRKKQKVAVRARH